ncbi:BTAD domain-containing putative transcriptional regulator [Nonomuraea longicatena]|uniref:BTAD domain-containing putative transcriptional regulator n=1 Tax=Nonomuraea longicatena TaxID=83682 RepID=A0ABN1PPG4_9ACTN
MRIGGARLRALLTLLALDAGRFVPVDSLAEALWPHGGPLDRAHALQSLVSRLRRALPGGVLRQGPGGYCLDVPPDAVDATRFERLAHEGGHALQEGRPDQAAALLREALALWRGEVADAVRLTELRLSAVEDRVRADLLRGAEPGPLVAELKELTAAHPLRERPRALLVQALHRQGRQAEALEAYESFRVLLADELGADPGPELQATHLAVLRGEAAGARGNLRAPLTSFVGRAEERAAIAARLRDNRLVTLVGPGGVGKSRLATKTAGELAVPGGVWLVELAPVTDPDDLVHAVAGALETAAPAQARPRDQLGRLAAALPAAETLIVLDDCEHLVEATARFAEDLLGRCPQLRVLATSREPLGILGEALFPVRPLPPDEGARLFAERAAAVRPDFSPDDEHAVAEICRRLDGLPLAIELAAARLRFLTAGQLAARLDDRFRVLTGGSRTALPRHRTLRAVVAWSWELLTDDERRSAQRLAVFPGTFAADAAPLVDELANKSLLQFTEGPRYRMLETIREYALERLAESGEPARARAEHAAYVLDLAERAAPELRGPGQLAGLQALRAERDNLLAALHYIRDIGDPSTAARLGRALSFFWTIGEDHAEAAAWLRLVLDVTDDPEVAAAYLLNVILSGDPTQASAEAGRLRELARDADPVIATVIRAGVASVTGEAAAGLAAIEAGEPCPDPWWRALLWFLRSALDGSLGDMEAMRDDLEAAVAAFRQTGERWGLAVSLSHLAFAQSTLGEAEAGIAALEESVRLARRLGTGDGDRVWLALLRVQIGDLDRARSELHGVLAGNPAAPLAGRAEVLLADLARADGDLAAAARHLERAARPGSTPDPSSTVLFLLASARLAMAQGRLDGAREQLAEAFELAASCRDLPLVGLVAVGVAELGLRRDPSGAAKVLGAAHALRGGAGARHPDVVRLTGALRDALGAGFPDGYDQGSRLDRGVALALVRARLTPP